MRKKDIILGYEIILTFLLLISAVYLQDWLAEVHKLYFIGILLLGFGFSWFYRKKDDAVIKHILILGILGTIVGLVYAVLTGSLVYQEIIIKSLRAVLIMLLILSFNVRDYVLNYIQALSVILFLSHCLFIIRSYNIGLILIYLFLFILIFKVKFYGIFSSDNINKFTRHLSFYLSIGLFCITVLFTWIISYKVLGLSFKKGGIFYWQKEQEEGLEKDYYILQDRVQDIITGLVGEFKSTEERYEIVGLLSSLVKELPYIVEMDKAEERLLYYLDTAGRGFKENNPDSISLLKEFLDKKVLLNLKRIKEDIDTILKKHPFNIKDRILVSSSLNRISKSNTHSDIKRYRKQALKDIEQSNLEYKFKKELQDHTDRLSNFKFFQVYHQKVDSFHKDLQKLADNKKQEFLDLISELRKIESIREIETYRDTLNTKKEGEDKEFKDFFDRLAEILDIKKDILEIEELRKIKEKLEEIKLSEYESEKLQRYLHKFEESEDYKNLQENFEKIKESIIGREDIQKQIEDILKMKEKTFLEKNKKDIEELMKEGILKDEDKQKLFQEIQDLENYRDINKIEKKIEQIKKEIEEFFKKGFISKGTEKEILKKIDEIRDILLNKAQREYPESIKTFFEKEEYNNIIEKLPIGEEKKNYLKELNEAIFKTDDILELENLIPLFEKELEIISNELKKEEAKKLKEEFKNLFEFRQISLMDNSTLELEKDIKKLKEFDPERAEGINKLLDEFKKTRDIQKKKEKLELLKKKLLEEQEKQEGKKGRSKNLYEIYILPERLIIPKNSLFFLEPIVIYNNLYFKDVSQEMEWYSLDPSVAWVDEKGGVHSVSIGKTKVFAVYKDTKSKEIDIIVLENIPLDIRMQIKKEMGF